MDEAEEHHQKTHKTIISALAWVDRGYAKAQLEEYMPTEQEIKANKKLAKKLLKGQDPNTMDIGEAKQTIESNLKAIDNAMAAEDSSDDDGTNVPVFTTEMGNMINKEKGIVNDMDDEYGDEENMKMDDNYPEELSDSEEEKDDYTIRKTDSLIVAATAEDDFSNLEVYIYDH